MTSDLPAQGYRAPLVGTNAHVLIRSMPAADVALGLVLVVVADNGLRIGPALVDVDRLG